jgi:hypothetical protein
MPETPEAMLHRKTQEGKGAMMDAIVELLKLHAGRRQSAEEEKPQWRNTLFSEFLF